MTKIVKIAVVVVGIGAAIGALVPAIKGPINRWRLEANEKLNAEYVVDNYKAEYVKLHEKRAKLLESMQRFSIEKKVAEKKLTLATNKVAIAKAKLVEIGTSDMVAFNKAKDSYETFNVEVQNFTIMVKTYTDAVAKLEKSLALIDANMAKAKLNVDTLSSKKTMLDTIKTVNSSIENMNGVGDPNLAINVEKIDDDLMRESIKLEALDNSHANTAPMTEAEAKAYIQNLK